MIRTVQITDTDSTVDHGTNKVAFASSSALRMGKTGASGAKVIASTVKHTIILPIVGLANIADAQVLKVAVPFPFTLNSLLFRVGDKAVTTAAKLSTLTAQVAGVSCTGGAVALTSANCTPSAATVAGSAITAGNTGAAGDTVGVVASSTTAFVEGNGWLEFNVTELSE